MFENTIQPKRENLIEDKFKLKGKWNKDVFKNSNPIILELGCGAGEYSIALGIEYSNKNFIGIDIKGARIWKGAKYCIDNKINNVVFLRTQIDLLEYIFAKNEISEIWITFPDPQIKYRRTKHRLTNDNFLNIYEKVLKKDGLIHLKTDSEFLHGYTLGVLHSKEKYKVLHSQHDVYKDGDSPDYLKKIQTYYEKIFLKQNKKITYIKFKIN